VAVSGWGDVAERLVRLAASRPGSPVFGSNGHGWALEPPLGLDEFAEVETQLKVELPAEADDGGFRPLLDSGRPIWFTRWYRRWLDEADGLRS
jgi:hypothetical protein